MISKLFFLTIICFLSYTMHAQINNDTTWSQLHKGLSIGITGTSEKDLEVFLKNTTQKDTIQVWSHVECRDASNNFLGNNLDWFHIQMVNNQEEEFPMDLSYNPVIGKPIIISQSLHPGQVFNQQFKLGCWRTSFPICTVMVTQRGKFKRIVEAIPKGKYQLYVTYEVKDETKKWQGKVQAGPHIIEIK